MINTSRWELTNKHSQVKIEREGLIKRFVDEFAILCFRNKDYKKVNQRLRVIAHERRAFLGL